MSYCTQCGHRLAVGRYCTNCGHAIAEGAATQARPVPAGPAPVDPAPVESAPVDPAPVDPAPVESAPPPARYPLYADEARPVAVSPNPTHPSAAPSSAAHPREPASVPAPSPRRRRRRTRGPWLLGAAAAVGVVALLVGLWTLGGDTERDRAAKEPADARGPTPSATDGEGGVGDLRDTATIDVPETAPPGVGADGERTTYDAAHLLDGIPETAWRMPGDGTGEELVVTLPAETTLRSVGLINGYAKTGTGARGTDTDWYLGNRRITQVEWAFDDGTTLIQELVETRAVQSVDIEVTTSTVTLRLVAVSAPGSGSTGRDFTAISDLSLIAG